MCHFLNYLSAVVKCHGKDSVFFSCKKSFKILRQFHPYFVVVACGWYLELGVVGICGCGVLLLWPGAPVLVLLCPGLAR